MALQGYGTELGMAAVTMIIIKDVIAPLIRRIPIFGNGKGNSKGLEKRVDELRDEGHDPESIPGKSEACIKQGLAVQKIGTTLADGTARLNRMEGKIDTLISRGDGK